MRSSIQGKNSKHAWHLYVIQLNFDLLNINRNEFISELSKNKIGTSVHFIPLHLHPFYRGTYIFNGGFSNAKYAYERIISLALYLAMSPVDIQYVIDSMKTIIIKHRKFQGDQENEASF